PPLNSPVAHTRTAAHGRSVFPRGAQFCQGHERGQRHEGDRKELLQGQPRDQPLLAVHAIHAKRPSAHAHHLAPAGCRRLPHRQGDERARRRRARPPPSGRRALGELRGGRRRLARPRPPARRRRGGARAVSAHEAGHGALRACARCERQGRDQRAALGALALLLLPAGRQRRRRARGAAAWLLLLLQLRRGQARSGRGHSRSAAARAGKRVRYGGLRGVLGRDAAHGRAAAADRRVLAGPLTVTLSQLLCESVPCPI
ncbi:hypothetical protein T492DRAFT_36648, partial [Pavlovales sp. CCMP2436]